VKRLASFPLLVLLVFFVWLPSAYGDQATEATTSELTALDEEAAESPEADSTLENEPADEAPHPVATPPITGIAVQPTTMPVVQPTAPPVPSEVRKQPFTFSPTPPPPTPTPTPTSTALPSDPATTIAQLINERRGQAGLWPLRNDPRLTGVSDGHNRWMDGHQAVCHACPGEVGLGERVDASGYLWLNVGEVVVLNLMTPEDVVAGLMASEEHRAILFGTRLPKNDIGCAFLPGAWGRFATCLVGWLGDAVPWTGAGIPAPTATARPR